MIQIIFNQKTIYGQWLEVMIWNSRRIAKPGGLHMKFNLNSSMVTGIAKDGPRTEKKNRCAKWELTIIERKSQFIFSVEVLFR
jgi:hypothetical protein